MLPRYPEMKLLFTDTDSLALELPTKETVTDTVINPPEQPLQDLQDYSVYHVQAAIEDPNCQEALAWKNNKQGT